MSCGILTSWSLLATRPVLFALARALAEAWPADALAMMLFGTRFPGKAG